MRIHELVLEFLSQLERKEAELLSWGVVDSAFSEDEIYELADRFLSEQPADAFGPTPLTADDVVEQLEEAKLLWRVADHSDRYRTRMAEGIRMLFRLRQILHWRTWETAANLIADYRLLLRPRAYPRRHLLPDQVRARIEGSGTLSALEGDVLACVLGMRSGSPMELADFQVNAAVRVLDEVNSRRGMSGTIVSAGTGSGKTLAFYLPALIAMATWSDNVRWTRCLSLYPRNELLKDQLSSAVRQVWQVNAVLRAHGRRPLTVGALFGGVPTNASARLGHEGLSAWERFESEKGWRCPYLSCPKCDQPTLIWTDADARANQQRLRCSGDGCDAVLGPDIFVLTREAMGEEPPDLLFTTLEMLNQRMSDPKLGRLFGLGLSRPEQRPRMVLLDEVHTYEGIYGAQAAILLRRWKLASGATPHFVGLSATLSDAQRFFAEFVDLQQSRVEDISPRAEQMEPRGQEYMLAVRGDPISQTNLLSASIQVAMLLRRLLDLREDEGVYGSKVFGFTDDLDVTNRLYHDLLDAEGWTLTNDGRPRPLGRNRINPNVRESWLATYRAPERADRDSRYRLGQSWDICEAIGHRMTGELPPVQIGRTSSQDVGVDENADIVVATASLEVGYDDDQVGAVLQHKAPMSAAPFLQRKGRAGRKRHMRPWTVVVLSCFGRDRIAYESYEQLFSPELQPRHLPTSNRYVLRIQAVYALLDWFSAQGLDGHVWQLLSQPPTGDYAPWARQRLSRVRDVVVDLLCNRRTQEAFASHLRHALRVEPEVVRGLMWDPPRSLMMAVLPTLARRIDREWCRATPPSQPPSREPHVFWSPLPEFIPRTLFADLNLPEVQIYLEGTDRPEAMPILQALREFAPGRITLRFGIHSRHNRYWIPLEADLDEGAVFLDAICPIEAREELGQWPYPTSEGIGQIRVVRPFELHVKVPPNEVLSSSNARLAWHSQLLPPEESILVDLPRGSVWRDVFSEFGFYTHAHANPIEVRRFASDSNFTFKRRGADPYEGSVRIVDMPGPDRVVEPVALGFTMDVDGLRIRVRPPVELYMRAQSADARVLRGLRSARFACLVDAHDGLFWASNIFQRQWLTRITLAAMVLEAIRDGLSLREAHQQILDRNMQPLEMVLDVIFRSLGDQEHGAGSERRHELQLLIRNPVFRDAFVECAPCLWQELDEQWEPWLTRRFRSTLAVGLREAAQQLCPDLDADDLCVDIDPGVAVDGRCNADEIWLSETSVGGGGFIEGLFRAYTADPRRFFGLLDAALGPSDLEDVHSELALLLTWLEEGGGHGQRIQDALRTVREARDHGTLLAAQSTLRDTLTRLGFRITHPVMMALHARILRPGSSSETDLLLARLMKRWDAVEVGLGIEVEAHVFAYLSSSNDDLDQALAQVSGELKPHPPEQWRFDTLYGLLWPRGSAVRSQGLQAYNPYHTLPESDRLLVLGTLDRQLEDIPLDEPHWGERLRAALISDGVAQLSAPLEQRLVLSRALMQLMLEPIDLGYLLSFPRVRGVTQEDRRLALILELAEVVQ